MTSKIDPRWSACVELLFAPEAGDVAERIRLAAAAGFAAVEFWSWRDKDLDAVERALAESGVALAGLVSEPMAPLTDPEEHERFLRGLRESLAVAKRLGAPVLIAQAGDELPGVPRAEQHRAIAAALRAAADILAGSGAVLALEPLNTRVDHPGTYLESTREGLDLIETVDRPEVRLLYDLYHSVVMGETPQEALAGRVELLAHVHLADAPGRHEPGTGEMPWREHLTWLATQGYAGRIGLEYAPVGTTEASLRWLGTP